MITILTQAAKIVGVSAHLLIAICTIETNLNNINNFNDKYAPSFGVCQIQVNTARLIFSHIDALALQQAEVNALVAAALIKRLNRQYEQIDEVIAAYNAGSVIYKDNDFVNREYVDKVLEKLE